MSSTSSDDIISRIKNNMSRIELSYNHTIIYFCSIDVIESKDIQYSSEFMSSERCEKIAKYRFENDQKRMLVCEALFHIALKELYGIDLKQKLKTGLTQIKISKYGKPYLDGYNIYFNKSHSGDFVVCVFSNKKVGVDIQLMNEQDYNCFESIIHPEEYVYIECKRIEERNSFFYEYWVMIESYFKALGTGLNEDIKNVHFDRSNNYIQVYNIAQRQSYFIQMINFTDGYKLAVCMRE